MLLFFLSFFSRVSANFLCVFFLCFFCVFLVFFWCFFGVFVLFWVFLFFVFRVLAQKNLGFFKKLSQAKPGIPALEFANFEFASWSLRLR